YIYLTTAVCIALNLNNFDVVVAKDQQPDEKTTIVEGRITFHGSLPPDRQIDVTRDAEYCGQSLSEALVIRDADTKGVSEVVVSIEGIEKSHHTRPQKSTQLANEKCLFRPRTQIAFRGSRLGITSVDPVLHNTHIHHKTKTFLNVAVPPNNRPIIKTLARPGMLDVRCDAHKFMEATIHVFQHPYFAMTGAKGIFKIPDVPPGTYQLNVWHHYLGVHSQTIHVPETDTHTIQVDLKK
ncbi:MAG: hypothetical protein ACPGYT_13285, partial [Nitrospirales bacterium]